MNNIVLISFFRSNNIGDITISDILYEQLSKQLPVRKYDISLKPVEKINSIDGKFKDISIKPKELGFIKEKIFWFKTIIKKYLPSTYSDIYKAIENCSVLVIAGGNIFMELNKISSITYKLHRLVKYSKKHNKKVIIAFAGVGPTVTNIQNRRIKKIFNKVDFISVRDNTSKNFLENLKVNNSIKVWHDPVFNLKCQKHYCKEKTIALNIYFGTSNDDKIKTIKNSYVELIEKLSLKNYNIILFSSEILDYNDIKEIYSKVNRLDNIAIRKINSLDDIIDLYNQSFMAITARMHSFIFACTTNTPCIALSWQCKITGLLNDMQLEDYLYDLENLGSSIDELIEKVDHIYENYNITKEKFENVYIKYNEESENNFSLLKKIVKE